MTEPIYDRLARLWPLLSPPSDYAVEAYRVREVLFQFGRMQGSDEAESPDAAQPSLLELGAGGGHTLVHLARGFDCTGVDLSKPMLANARALVPEGSFVAGDMRTIRLGGTFDAVLIHDSIDYMITPADAQAALDTAAAHLEHGGIAIIAPTYVRETFADHALAQDANTNGNIELAYLSTVRREHADADHFELIMLLMVKENGQLTVNEDRHTCGLFTRDAWIQMLDAAGFDVYMDEAMISLSDEASDEADEGNGDADDGGVFDESDEQAEALPWFIGIKR